MRNQHQYDILSFIEYIKPLVDEPDTIDRLYSSYLIHCEIDTLKKKNTSTMVLCKHVLKRGKRKGETCMNKVKQNQQYCFKHLALYNQQIEDEDYNYVSDEKDEVWSDTKDDEEDIEYEEDEEEDDDVSVDVFEKEDEDEEEEEEEEYNNF